MPAKLGAKVVLNHESSVEAVALQQILFGELFVKRSNSQSSPIQGVRHVRLLAGPTTEAVTSDTVHFGNGGIHSTFELGS